MVLLKNAKFLIAVFCLMIFAMADDVEATLLWDGTFKGIEQRTGVHAISGNSNYNTGCMPQPDSFAVVSVSNLSGGSGKTGYAAKFLSRPGISYACDSSINDQHNHIAKSPYLAIPSEIWIGWDVMLDSAWANAHTWNIMGGVYVSEFTSSGIVIGGSGIYLMQNQAGSFILRVGGADYSISNIPVGIWNNIKLHIIFAKDTSGLVELYVNDNLVKTVNAATQDPTATQMQIRVGTYRGYLADSTQILYVLNPKAGTTRTDVEGTSNPTSTDNTPPTISITCPSPGTYSSPAISVSGTASDNVGISKVEVKVGSAGAWKTTTGTTSWSIYGLTLASGANTIYARATDTSGNIKETSIAITYSASATQPSGTLLFDGSFQPTDYRIDQNHWHGSWGSDTTWNACLPRSDSLSVVSGIGGRDNVGKFNIYPGDLCESHGTTNERAMLAWKIYDGEGVERYYSVSAYFPSSGYNPTAWTMFYEVMPVGYNGPLTALYASSYFDLFYGVPGAHANIGPIVKDKWVDWIIREKWSGTTNGFIEVYQRISPASTYSLVFSKYNIQTLQKDAVGNTRTTIDIDAGPYRGAQPSASTLYLSNIKIGTTRASVEYGSSAPSPIWSGDYETGDFSQWSDRSCLFSGSNPQRSQILPGGRQGKYYAGLTAYAGDVCNTPLQPAGARERVGVLNNFQFTPYEAQGNDFYVSFSHKLPSDWIDVSAEWVNVLSFSTWGANQNNFAELAFQYQLHDGKYRMDIRRNEGTPVFYTHSSINPYQKGIWHDFIFHVKYSATNTGIVEVWHRKEGEADYQLILAQYDTRTDYSIGGSQKLYLQQTLYRGYNIAEKQTAYYDNIRVGTTFASVTDGSSSSSNPAPSCTAPTTNPNPQPTTISLTLKPGWNQISSPLAAGIDIATIEAAGCIILPYKNQKLWAWNAAAQVWINPTKVEPFKGYWIYAAYQCNVPLSGTQATFTSLPLTVGWNKISAQGTFSAIQGTCAGHITGNWVWNWDKASEKWIHPTTMQLDKGYWIKVDQNCMLDE